MTLTAEPLGLDSQEAKRLARLRMLAVMDTEAEPIFDSLARMASTICGTPIALVTLLDDKRQWFKANVGLESTRQTDRETAFCAHAIQGSALMEVCDTHEDKRFSQNVLVTGEPGIRFYAGVPLVMPEGERLGTLCVIDREVRHLNTFQRDTLGQLADMVVQALILRERSYYLEIVDQDMARRKEIDAQLRASNSFLDRAERIAGVGGWEVDLRTRAVKWTDQNKRIFDLPLDFQPTFEGHLVYFGAEGQRIIEQTANESIRTGKPWDLELPMRTTTGRQVWTRSVGVVEYEDGHPARLVGALQDITARKAAELELLQANHLLQTVMENLPGGLSVFNDELLLTAHNPQFRQMLGLPDSLFDGPVTTFESIIRHNAIRGDYGNGPVEPIISAIVERARNPVDHHFQRALPGGLVLDIRGAPMPGGGFVTTYVDVSAAQAAAVELQKAKLAAEAANQAKSNFLTTMSHEIRTPLNGILGITQLLLDEPLSAQQSQFARLIDGSAQSLLVLLNDFLDLAKIDAGKTVLEEVPFNLTRLLADVTDLFTYRASAKSLVFNNHVAPIVPQWIWGDPARLRQILANLLSNALKFTDTGAVSLTVDATDSAPGCINLVFAISDTGIGIPVDMQSHVFSNFVQADASTTRKYGGTGLGLSIVKQLAELMGGRVDLHSVPGQGSTFTLVLQGVRLAAESVSMAPTRRVEQGVVK